MYRITREITFSYGHRLLNHDGKCRHLHGHNGRVVLSLEVSQLNSVGMVMDFARVKQVVKTWLDTTFDHRMILHRDDPALPVLRQLGEPVVDLDVNPTAENLARLIYEFALHQGFPVVEVQLWETDSCSATYSGAR
jgi:6-pyruvoyltetrahydropterin/6-carboxytetrahydropterin synthase